MIIDQQYDQIHLNITHPGKPTIELCMETNNDMKHMINIKLDDQNEF